MLHCDCFNKDVDKRVTKISGSGRELDIEMAELILAYISAKSEVIDGKSLLEIANDYHNGNYEVSIDFVHDASKCVFDSLEIALGVLMMMLKDEEYIKAHERSTRIAYTKTLSDVLNSLKDGEE